MKYYTLEWIFSVFKVYQTKKIFYIEKKQVSFKPKFFLLALLHLYQKKHLSLEDLSEFLSIKKEDILYQRSLFDFMHLVDLLRKEFASWFRDLLISRDFSEETYETLAREFLLLEEQLRKQIQIPLLNHIKNLNYELEDQIESGKVLSKDHEKVFFRILKFFDWVENFQESLCSRLVNRAKELVEKAYPERVEFFNKTYLTKEETFKQNLKEELKRKISMSLEL
ncbi:MAG: hypothetical protein NZ530_01470 [Thermodesulfobacteriaceae bacterium]|nr:hypothetical protein [Thermodesulfobacteriaceae bacterium]MCX8041181.1 hypothetical protein [Thermodesulfobacteriaceae bacterium]MDW8135181.1 hypothetical protein [Thermodesulfobacterium sp.]